MYVYEDSDIVFLLWWDEIMSLSFQGQGGVMGGRMIWSRLSGGIVCFVALVASAIHSIRLCTHQMEKTNISWII